MSKKRGKRPMTPKMLKLLQFIKNYTKKNKYSPTLLPFLKKLEERDEIKRDYAGYSRNIEING